MTKLPAPILAIGLSLAGLGASAQADPPYPDVADASHATSETAAFLASFFSAKSRHDVAATMAHFAPDLSTYTDATLGWRLDGFGAVEATLAAAMPGWGEGLSYPTRVLGAVEGGDGSALVAFTDTPELFGDEIRILGAVDVRDGRIVRWVDYWDASGFDAETYAARAPRTSMPPRASGRRRSARPPRRRSSGPPRRSRGPSARATPPRPQTSSASTPSTRT